MYPSIVAKWSSFFALSLFAYCAWADVPPLEVDGLRSVLIRGRVIAPIIPPPGAVDLDTALPNKALPNSDVGEAVLPVPPRALPGREPEPTPADPKKMQRPASPVKPVPARRLAEAQQTEGNPHRLASMHVNVAEETQGKGRDADRDDSRPRLGIFRRRR